jgi:hypothetical protein
VCGSIPATACGECLASEHPADCLACALDARAAPEIGRALFMPWANRTQRGCALCGNINDAARRKQ